MGDLSHLITTIIQRGNKLFFDVSRQEEEDFLQRLGDAKDDLDRSYKQYQCQNFFMSKWKVLALNAISFVALPLSIVALLLRHLIIKRKNYYQAIGDFNGIKEIIPSVLHERFNIFIGSISQGSLSIRDIKFITKMVGRYPFSPYYSLKCALRISAYSQAIYQHDPEAIIVHNEPSFTSSALTSFCNSMGVKHINVMHGEKLFFIRDSYFRFDECYVWSDYYIKLFTEMKADYKQFRVAIPSSLVIDVNKYKKPSAYSDYKYFLGAFDENQLSTIVKSLGFIKKSGKTIRYRPHPRYSNIDLLRKYVSEDEIEMPNDIDILTSVSNLEVAIGSYTTVLTQAYFSGKGVILDNVAFSDQYNKLSEMGYYLSGIGLPVLTQYQE